MPLMLGKKPAQPRPELKLEKYVDFSALPTPPQAFDYSDLISIWGMLGNGPDDSVAPGFGGAGDCVWAGADHETMLWTAESGNPATFIGANAISDYSACTGYDPKTGNNDNGTDVQTALKYRLSKGIVDADGKRHKIGAYVSLDPKNLEHLYIAADLFSAVGIGFEFPDSAMDQFSRNEPWDVVAGANVVGGHYVCVVKRPLSVISWAKVQPMTEAFYEQYNDEAYGLITNEMLKSGLSVTGLDWDHLMADFKELGTPIT